MTLHAGENFLAGASEHTIENLTLSIANFEYSYEIPARTRKMGIKPRSTTAEIKISFVVGESGTKYISIPPGGWWQDLVGLSNKVIYMQTTTAGIIAEIETWS